MTNSLNFRIEGTLYGVKMVAKVDECTIGNQLCDFEAKRSPTFGRSTLLSTPVPGALDAVPGRCHASYSKPPPNSNPPPGTRENDENSSTAGNPPDLNATDMVDGIRRRCKVDKVPGERRRNSLLDPRPPHLQDLWRPTTASKLCLAVNLQISALKDDLNFRNRAEIRPQEQTSSSRLHQETPSDQSSGRGVTLLPTRSRKAVPEGSTRQGKAERHPPPSAAPRRPDRRRRTGRSLPRGTGRIAFVAAWKNGAGDFLIFPGRYRRF